MSSVNRAGFSSECAAFAGGCGAVFIFLVASLWGAAESFGTGAHRGGAEWGFIVRPFELGIVWLPLWILGVVMTYLSFVKPRKATSFDYVALVLNLGFPVFALAFWAFSEGIIKFLFGT